MGKPLFRAGRGQWLTGSRGLLPRVLPDFHTHGAAQPMVLSGEMRLALASRAEAIDKLHNFAAPTCGCQCNPRRTNGIKTSNFS